MAKKTVGGEMKKDWNIRVMLKGETRSRYPRMIGYYTEEEAIKACKKKYGRRLAEIFWVKAETRFGGISSCYLPAAPTLEELLSDLNIKVEDLIWDTKPSEWVDVAKAAGYMG